MESTGHRLLEHARELVAESWCSGADARDASGLEVDPWDEEAANWSLLGAVVAVLEQDASPAGELPLAELVGALYALGALISTESLADWSDEPRQTQANVVAVLERAAAKCADNCALFALSLN